MMTCAFSNECLLLYLYANHAPFLCAFANLIGFKDVPNSSLVDLRTLCLPAGHTILSLSYLILFSAVDVCCILDSMLVWDP